MKKLNSMTFSSDYELTEFINSHLISIGRENIQQITATEILAGYSAMTTYTLFWWE